MREEMNYAWQMLFMLFNELLEGFSYYGDEV